jgi:hypothetical protein
MFKLNNLYLRTFCIISNDKAVELNLHHIENVHGDRINHLNCRSIWEDLNGGRYRVKSLHLPTIKNIRKEKLEQICTK